MKQVISIKPEAVECITSYDVMALLTSVPLDPTIAIIKNKLEKIQNSLTAHPYPSKHHCNVGVLPQEYHFLFQGVYYEEVQGAAMGSPIIPIMANLFMEDFEVRTISTSNTPRLWRTYVDDTFVIQKIKHRNQFLEHIISIDLHIQFTTEDNRLDGSMPFFAHPSHT